ncbi:MAG: RsmD family RNA methyltransferase [Polyangiaceae bacterium]
MTRTLDVVIERWAAGGSGVARVDGGAMLVPGACAGERVRVAIDPLPARGAKQKTRRSRLLTVLEPSPDRVEPPCAYVGACGGCDFMHVAATRQLEILAPIVHGMLVHATGVPVPEPSLARASKPLGYRTRARLAFDARGRSVAIGYRRGGSHELTAIDRCLVLDERLAVAIDEARSILEGSRARGELSIALGEGGRPVLEMRPESDLAAAAFTRIDAACAARRLAGARVWPAGSSAPIAFGDPRVVHAGPDGAPVRLPPGSFAQPSDDGAALLATRLRAAVESLVPTDARARASLVELFSGSGGLTLTLAAMGFASSTSVEIDAAACAEAKENLALRGLRASVVRADADAHSLAGADLVVLDPPRTGARGAVSAIVAARPRWVAYVSCDPPTLARDVAVLTAAGYAIGALEVVELFPQTSHVETIVTLERVRRRPA